MFRKALEDVSRKEGVKVSDGSEQSRGSVYEDAGLNELAERHRRGDLSQAEYLEAYNEYLEQNPGLEEDFFEGRQFDLDENAESEVDQVLTNINYQGEVKLTKNSPSILLNQPGVKNLPMLMNASHIRENILTEEEARKLGLKVNPNINYHGLGKTLFLDVIAGLDDVTEAYRGTKNAENSERRENYFILISKYTDKNGDVINVPVFINEKGLYNRIFIDTNKIATVFGRSELRRYLNNQIHNGNLVRIKKRSPQAGESTSPINADYGMKTPKNIISNSNGIVNTQNKKSDFDDANDFADEQNPGLEDEDFFEGRSFDLDEEYNSNTQDDSNFVLDSFGINEISDYIHVQRRVIDTLNSEGFFSDSDGKTRTAVNKKSGLTVEIRPDGIKETFNLNNYSRKSKLLKTAKLAIVRHIPQIIETGKLLSDKAKNIHFKNKEDVMYAYIEKNILINRHPATVLIAVRKTPQKNKFWVHQIDIKNNVVSQPGRSGDANSITTGNSAYDIAISIPEDLLPVKTLSRKNVGNSKKPNKLSKKHNRQYDFDDANDFADDEMLYDSSFAAKYDPNNFERSKAIRKEREKRKEERKADEFSSRGLEGKDWWSKNRNKADRMFNKRELERLSRIKSELEDADELTVEQVTALWGEMRKLQRNVTAMSMAHQITNEELTQVTDLLRGDRTIEDIEKLPADRYNIDGIIAVAKAKLEYTITK